MAGSEINSIDYKTKQFSNKHINKNSKLQAQKDNQRYKSKETNPDYLVDISITAKMKSNHYSLIQALKNNRNSREMLDNAERYLDELNRLVRRIRNLNTNLVNNSSKEESTLIQIELSELIDEVDRIASYAEFNKMKLFTGAFSKSNPVASMWFQFGYKNAERKRLYLRTMTAKALKLNNFKNNKLTNKSIDRALEKMITQRSEIKDIANHIKIHTKKILRELNELSKYKNIILNDEETFKLIKNMQDE